MSASLEHRRELAIWRCRTVGPLAWSVCGVTSALAGAALALSIAGSSPNVGGDVAGLVTFGLVFPCLGAVLAHRRPANPIGWIFCAVGLLQMLCIAGSAYADYALITNPGSLPAAGLASWFAVWPWAASLGLLATFLPLLFPTGRLPSARWAWVAWLAAGGLVVETLPVAIVTWPHRGLGLIDRVGEPVGLEAAEPYVLAGLSIHAVTSVAAASSLAVRFRHSRDDERQQLKWFLVAVCVTVVLLLNAFTPWRLPELTLSLAIITIPLAVAVAILKYRLYQIDVVIRISMVYGVLTLCIVGIYITVVGLLGSLVQPPAGRGLSLIAALLVAVLLAPLRERLQRAVDVLMYGHRHDPYEVFSLIGQRLEVSGEPDSVLPDLAETLAQALRLSHVGIEIAGAGGRQTVSCGQPDGHTLRLTLTHRAQIVGWLSVTPRAGERLSASDRLLLQDLARQTALVVHTLGLAVELQRSRERLVTAREEERRRLRRDLHDGLGPALAAVRLRLDSTRRLAGPGPVADALTEVREEVRKAVVDIRRLVYDLRPPTLDELGLAAALREQAEQLAGAPGPSRDGAGLTIEADIGGDLDRLPAAVEVAAYRIATEALTNVVRHSGARHCRLRVLCAEGLQLEVTDDGSGLPADCHVGVGLTSMRERTSELGGSLTITSPLGGGTRVVGRLPLGEG